jgi:glucose-1-phosphate thymidylyltransferase
MKGVILAGGTGSRLFPSTKVINKHLLPVYNRPMILYPLETLKESGIQDILIITSQHNAGDFMRLLGSGSEYGVRLTYKIQDGSGGIAQALGLAESFVGDNNMAVILGDNIFRDNFSEDVLQFKSGAKIFTKQVEDAERFGVVEIDQNGLVQSIEEKPVVPKSNLAQTGFYLYDSKVFDTIRELEPSQRGELEITDVNLKYLEEGELFAGKVYGSWIDAGTHDSLLEASIIVQDDETYGRQRQRQSAKKTVSIQPKVTVGIVTHNSEGYLSPCLKSVLNVDYDNLEVVVLDNDSHDDTRKIIREDFSESVRLITSEENLGFSKGHNEIIRQSDGTFYLCFNVDAILEKNSLSDLVRTIEQKPIYGAAVGKIKQWNFSAFQKGDLSQGKTNFIDSVGIKFLRSHRFEDSGQGEVDFGQYNEEKDIFGGSGAAVLLRRKALEDVSYMNKNHIKEYFDEAMFMYKEDIDLAYRLQWAGWKCRYTPKSVFYHDRTAALGSKDFFAKIKNRWNKSSKINKMSYLHHQILLEKNFAGNFSLGVQGATFWYNAKVFFYVLIFEWELLPTWWKIFTSRKRLQRWRRLMPRRVTKYEIEQLMEG